MPRIIGVFVSSLAVLGFVSMASASTLSPKTLSLVAPDILFQVDSKCKNVDGKLVGDCKKNGKNHRDDDDDDDDRPKNKGKNKKEDSGLTECTIQTPNSGGGCKNGTWKCEKMKSGKKCCGCVPNKNAPGGGGGNEPPKDTFCCTAVPSDGAPTATVCKGNQKEAYKAAHAAVTANGKTVGQMTCNKQVGQ